MSEHPLIFMEGLSKVFYTEEVETHALSNINLQIQTGEFVSIAHVGLSVQDKLSLTLGVVASDGVPASYSAGINLGSKPAIIGLGVEAGAVVLSSSPRAGRR